MALSGNLAETSFADLIQFYSISRQTAAVTVESPAGREHDVVVFIENGEIVDARFGPITGVDAVRRALRLREGEFHVDLNVTAGNRTIWESCSKLLLEEMVSDDEEKKKSASNGHAGAEEIMVSRTEPPAARISRRHISIVSSGTGDGSVVFQYSPRVDEFKSAAWRFLDALAPGDRVAWIDARDIAAELAAEVIEPKLEGIAHVVADHRGRAAEGRDKTDLDGVARQGRA